MKKPTRPSGPRRNAHGFYENDKYAVPKEVLEHGRIHCFELKREDGVFHRMEVRAGYQVLGTCEIGRQPAVIVWEPVVGALTPLRFRSQLMGKGEVIPLAEWIKLRYVGTVYIHDDDIGLHIYEDRTPEAGA